MKDWTDAEVEAYDDFMDSWANSHLCETEDETLGSEEPVIEFKIVELHAVDPFFP
jgi:hypothetical protein